jgi:hypothetical protein
VPYDELLAIAGAITPEFDGPRLVWYADHPHCTLPSGG